MTMRIAYLFGLSTGLFSILLLLFFLPISAIILLLIGQDRDPLVLPVAAHLFLGPYALYDIGDLLVEVRDVLELLVRPFKAHVSGGVSGKQQRANTKAFLVPRATPCI